MNPGLNKGSYNRYGYFASDTPKSLDNIVLNFRRSRCTSSPCELTTQKIMGENYLNVAQKFLNSPENPRQQVFPGDY